MKRLVAILTVLILCVASMLPATVSAASASASLTGPDTVRAGDTITLSFDLSGSGLYGASGTLSYDSNQVTLSSTTQKIGSPWVVEFNGNNFVAYDNNLSNPVNGKATLFTATFTVKSVDAGSNISISYTNVIASDGSADENVGTVTYTKTVAAPLSTNNNLASLTVNTTITPAFSPDTTNYTASVPFEVSKLNVSATAADGKAKVSINNSTLTPNGTTKLTITVTAENGAKKDYTISVKRAQDPNYKASGNNKLSGIEVEGFRLSPLFDADTTRYVVWLPYEADTIKISGTAADTKASVVVVGGDKLAAGQDNVVQVICTAENGEKKEYTVVVKRAAGHDGTVDAIPEETEPLETEPLQTEPTEPIVPTTPDVETPSAGNGIAWWWLLVVGAGMLAIGLAGGYFGKEAITKFLQSLVNNDESE